MSDLITYQDANGLPSFDPSALTVTGTVTTSAPFALSAPNLAASLLSATGVAWLVRLQGLKYFCGCQALGAQDAIFLSDGVLNVLKKGTASSYEELEYLPESKFIDGRKFSKILATDEKARLIVALGGAGVLGETVDAPLPDDTKATTTAASMIALLKTIVNNTQDIEIVSDQVNIEAGQINLAVDGLEALVTATNAKLAALDTELKLKADLTETQPVSMAAAAPLPPDAATETTLGLIKDAIEALASDPAKINASPSFEQGIDYGDGTVATDNTPVGSIWKITSTDGTISYIDTFTYAGTDVTNVTRT